MHGYIEVVTPPDWIDRREVWRFYYHEHTLYLDSHQVQTRASRRHKWKVDERYNRLNRSGENKEVCVIPPYVAAVAKQNFVDSLTVARWEDRKK